jgi:hypothetical protein
MNEVDGVICDLKIQQIRYRFCQKGGKPIYQMRGVLTLLRETHARKYLAFGFEF